MRKEDIVLNDKFAKHLGMQIVEVAKGYAKTKLTIQQDFLNGLDFAHGGVIFSLADYAFALASNTPEESGLAISANIHFIKPAVVKEEIFARSQRSFPQPEIRHLSRDSDQSRWGHSRPVSSHGLFKGKETPIKRIFTKEGSYATD